MVRPRQPLGHRLLSQRTDIRFPILKYYTPVSQRHVVLHHGTSALLRQRLLPTRPVSGTQDYLRSRLSSSTIMVHCAGPPGTLNLQATNHVRHDFL